MWCSQFTIGSLDQRTLGGRADVDIKKNRTFGDNTLLILADNIVMALP
jgi:hypothetical protein